MSLQLQNSGKGSGDGATLYMSGTVIYAQAKPSKNLYIIKRGEVRLVRAIGSKVHVLKICTTGDILNDVSVLTNKATDHAAIARSDVEIIAIEAKDVRGVIGKCPKWIPDLLDTLCERLNDSQEIINEHNLQSGPMDPSLVLSKEEEKILLQKLTDFNG